MKLYKITKSDIDKKGRGLYAAQNIKQGTRILDYVGKIITKKTLGLSKLYCDGKVVSILEGGYDLLALQESTEMHVKALLEFD